MGEKIAGTPHIFLLSVRTVLFSFACLLMASSEAHPLAIETGSCDVGTIELPTPPPGESVGKILDITHAYTENSPYWTYPEGLGQFLRLTGSMKNGSLANFSEMKLPTHIGTHVDAPGHFYQDYFEAGFDVDTLDLAILNGYALLVDVPRDKNITADVMESLHIPRGVRRVLFRTLNTDRKLMYKREYDTSYVGFMKDGAQWLVDNTDIKLVGIDYLSVAADDDLVSAHLIFLKSREIILVEGLKLDNVKPGIYTLHCLPLRLRGAEGSPIRLSWSLAGVSISTGHNSAIIRVLSMKIENSPSKLQNDAANRASPPASPRNQSSGLFSTARLQTNGL